MKDIFKAHNLDARQLKSIIKDKIVDVTITSPPYFDLKDYGSEKQIGFGQDYDEYLNDLKTVFQNVYDVTKDNGTLWVVIDTFKRDGILVPLPFDFANKIADIGWKLQEVIIWGKDRTVPWTHKGQMRKLFEYILVFSKTDDYNFYIDEVRDFQSLKKWWIKYPERYNPKGKTPEAIWNFNIPIQGSWGDGYIRHFCPLPSEMISQILKLTTKENDVVLDCFSGSGAVLFQANVMKRKFVGFDLNEGYIKMFNDYLEKVGKEKKKEYELEKKGSMSQGNFQKVILELRALKYARLLLGKLKKLKVDHIEKIYVEKTRIKPEKNNGLVVIKYHLLVDSPKHIKKISDNLDEIVSKAPLSKFGIEPNFIFVKKVEDFITLAEGKRLFVYNLQTTHRFSKEIEAKELSECNNNEMIYSKIKANLNEKDYE